MKKRFLIFIMAILCSSFIFAATMDSKVRSVPKDAAELVFKKPKEGLPLVVKHLAAGGGTGAVKALHDWICDNIAYDTDMYFSGKITKQDYESVLKKKKAVCSGYTNLMNEMCRLAGIESIGIEGYSKGFGYQGKLGDKTDHAWNAVKMNAKWQLIDVTWDAGYVDYKTFIKCYSTEWLYRTPAQFIYSHLPEKDEFQYLPKPKTKEEFVKEPYVPGIFFDYGLAFGKNAPDYTNAIDGAANFDFKLTKTGIAVSADLTDKDNKKGYIDNAVWVDRIGSRIALDVDIPDSNKYRVYVAARNRAEASFPSSFPVNEFEGNIIPQAQQLLAEKKIIQKEYENLEKSYFKVEENKKYYLQEDLFANERNTARTKILKMIYKDSAFSENVLYFDVIPAEGYKGFGNTLVRFPTVYRSYMETSNTHLISPTGGVLKKGEHVKFEVESKDFVGMAINGGDSLIPLVKDPKTGTFTFEYEIPDNTEQIAVFGSKNGKNYSGLWFYTVK